ncbi:MAG: dTDP-4-dehydrorhamnose reductase [Lachnospiraceae bacterium]|nr:dTDP-4-dehydrorhamnose reductase [Candidatus Colinaster scatohippi]
MKKIIVTGCNGQLGREINKFYADKRGIEFVNTDVDELDITDIEAVMELCRGEKPYAIINCAAYTAVDACETNQDLAFKINTLGPRNLAIAATEVGAKLVHISTDYVFDGTKQTPYMEYDKPQPQSVYGITKSRAEDMVKHFCHRYFIFRTAWLYGDGKNFVKTMLNLAETHDTVTVVNDQFGTPTSTVELVKAIDSIIFTDNYGTYHATCEGSTNWANFAEEIFRIAGKDTKVIPTSTAAYGAPAPRPLHSILENYMLKMVGGYTFADWHDALEVYMKELGY